MIELIDKELREGVLVLTLNRPERRNALSRGLRDALADAIDAAALDSSVRAVVLIGAGRNFCAGGDLDSFEDLHDQRYYRHVSHALSALMDSVERLEKPVIGALDGAAAGAGLTLALCCDWRIGTPESRMLFREGRLNMVPTHGGIARLVKLVGLARAKQALLGGDDLTADSALALGLIADIVPADELLDAAHARAQKMLGRAPMSYGAAKRLLHLAADADLRSTILAESLAQGALLQTHDHREGLAAVRERREPEFQGR